MKSKILILILLTCFNIDSFFAQTWESFTAATSGLPDNMVNSITISSDGSVWFATDSGLASYKNDVWNVFFKSDDGLSSNKINFVSFLPLDSNKLWAASNSGATILNVDSSSSISDPQYITKANNNIVSDTVRVIDLDGLSDNWIGTDKGLSVITNSGVYNFTEENGFESSKVNSLKSLSDNWVHIGTAGGGVKRLKYNGIDAVTSASEIITTWSGLASDSVLTIYVTDDTLRWYGTTEGVSTHFGEDTKDIKSWGRYNTVTSGIIDNYVRAIIRDNTGNMWFGTRKGLSKLSPDKSTWQSFTEQDGLIGNNIFDLEVDSDNNLWIATDKGVSYLINLPSSVHQKEPVDYQIKLANYPNPFNPETKIDYTIPKSGKVKLEVFDNLGSLIKVLVNKTHNAGNYQVSFSGDNLPSGIYLYRLTTERSSITKKMVLIR
jgi:ligand-binding sensor domain-containing protein